MRPEFELNHLKYFYFTVLEGKVAQAADRLHVQQPVVSKMIRSLEERLGQDLFKKQGRRKVLTDYGQLVYRHCQVVFQELDRLENIAPGKSLSAGPLNVGAVEPVAAHLLPTSLDRVMDEFKGVHPNIYTSTATQLLTLISERKLEFGLFFHIPAIPDGIEIFKRVPYRFRLVIAAKHAQDNSVIESFIGSREIDDNSVHRFPTMEKMRKDHPGVRITFSTNHLGLHREMVLNGRGVSILPDFLIAKDVKSGKMVDLYPKEKFMFDMKMAGAKGRPLTKPAQRLVEILSKP